MARVKGSGVMGPVRSLRLPRALEHWFQQRLMKFPDKSSSELLVNLLHGGLRLQDKYMLRHFERLTQLVDQDDRTAYRAYADCLHDSFGPEYVEHIESWLKAEGYEPLIQDLASTCNNA